jgi:hypothetical protein
MPDRRDAHSEDCRMRSRNAVIVFSGVLIGMAASTWVVLRAQIPVRLNDPASPIADGRQPAKTKAEPSVLSSKMPTEPKTDISSIQQAMLRPYRLPFVGPTTLEAVRAHLKKTLNIPVVLDRAALARQALTPDDTVQLELDGVRLKTGLQLLLDQVGLTYHIVPEDDLLVLTDREGSDDPLAKLRAEVRELHRDVHAIQYSIDDLTDLLVPEGLDLRMRKPTIIEELPELQEPRAKSPPGDEVPGDETSPHPRSPGRRSGGRIKPAPPMTTTPPAENPPPRVPLGHSRKRV